MFTKVTNTTHLVKCCFITTFAASIFKRFYWRLTVKLFTLFITTQKNIMSERLAQLQTFLAKSPNDPFLQYATALEYLKLLDYDAALNIFTALVTDNPNYVGTYYHLGKLQEKMEQFSQALDTYKQGMEVATRLADRHSYNELQGAWNLLTDELSDDW